MVALYAITDDGACSELALVSHEGVVGLCSAMGNSAIFNNAMAVVGGPSWRLSTDWFRQEVMNDHQIMPTILRHTQALIARLMGVRCKGVTEAAVRLQRLGLIRYTRGCITVTDRVGLERATCECYGLAHGRVGVQARMKRQAGQV